MSRLHWPRIAAAVVLVLFWLAIAGLWRATAAARADGAPDIIAAVARETARHGWPHPITQREAAAVTRTVFAAQHLSAGGGLCHFGATVARGWCGIVPAHARPYRVDFRVHSDGSWQAHRAGS